MDGERRPGGAASHSDDGLDESTSSHWGQRSPKTRRVLIFFFSVDLEDAGDADDQSEERREVGSQNLHEHGHVVENISKESERREENTAWSPSATGNIQNQRLVLSFLEGTSSTSTFWPPSPV